MPGVFLEGEVDRLLALAGKGAEVEAQLDAWGRKLQSDRHNILVDLEHQRSQLQCNPHWLAWRQAQMQAIIH